MAHSINEAGRLVSVSDAWLEKLGYSREEVLGRLSIDFLTQESRERAATEVVPKFFQTGRVENVRYQMLKKGGGVLDVLMSAVLTDDLSGAGRVSVAISTDVTALLETKRLLKDSEARYRNLVEDQSELVSLSTPEGELTYVNHAYAALCGLNPEDMIGRTLLSYLPEGERAAVARHLQRVCASREKIEVENEFVLPSGERRWIAWTNRALIDAEGRTVIHSVGRDVQKRVDADRLRHQSEARYRFLADHSSDLILLVGSNGKRLYASPASHKLLGYEPDELIAMRLQEMIHPDDAPNILPTLHAPPTETVLTYRIRRKDGVYVWVETTGRTVEVAEGENHRLVIVREIEQRMEAERRLRASETRYRLLADNSTDVIMALDRNLVRTYVSPSSAETFGYSPEELIGLPTGGFAHPEDAEGLRERLQTLFEGKTDTIVGLNRRQHRDGRWIWLETCYRAVRDAASGEISGFVASARDVTTRKLIEDKLAELNSRLHALAGQDALTGLSNRRTFDEALFKEYNRAKQENCTVALLMIDVDQFKSFNDLYGHPAGDKCLRDIADAIVGTVRKPDDLAARYGGEEFAVVLSATDETKALTIAFHIQRAVLDLAIEHKACDLGIVTISVGVAAVRPGSSAEDEEALLRAADKALYVAKNGGKNKVVLASPAPAKMGIAPLAAA